MKQFYLLILFIVVSTNNIFPQQTNPIIDSLETVLSSVKDREKIDVLNELAKELRAIAPQNSLEYATEANLLAQSEDYVEGEALAIKNSGTAYLYMGNLDTAIYLYSVALEKYKSIDDVDGVASSLVNIGNIHSMHREYSLALENYAKSLHYFETLNNLQFVANINRLIGIVYGNLYDYPKALKYFRKSSELAIEIGDENILAYSYNNIAITYESLHEYDNASLYYRKAIDVFEKTGNLRGVNMAKANLSNTYANLNDFDNAIALLQDCINFSKETGDKQGYAMYLSNIGMMYSEKGDSDIAIDYIQQALQLHTELQLKAELSRDLMSLGVIYLDKSKLNTATKYLKEALPIALETDDFWVIATCYQSFSEINASNGKLSVALENYKLFKAYNDSTLTKENQDKLAEMEVKYQTEQKEKENQLLQQDVQIKEMVINQKNSLIIIFIIVILVVVTLMFIIYFFYAQKSKTLRVLVQQNLKSLEIEKKIEKCIVDTPLQTSSESDSDMQNNILRQKFEKFMVEEKPYLWVDVNMDEFCIKLNTNRTYLSKLINNHYNQSFNDLLFEYRIRAARELLSDPSKTHLSVEGIGELAGFKSNATFHKKFKSLLHLTPQQFRSKALKRTA